MGTRGVIARKTKNGFIGRYHHWDSYPSGLGKTLWDLYHGHFNHNLKAMLEVLIDKHPAGWSTIVGKDFNLKAGFVNNITTKDIEKQTKRYMRPKCYCHGDRKETPFTITEKNACEVGCEWCYAFDEDNKTMYIMASFNEDNTKMIGFFGCGNSKATWRIVAEVDLNGKEPEWEKLHERIKKESEKAYQKRLEKEKQKFLENSKKAFAQFSKMGLDFGREMAFAHYKLWYFNNVRSHLDKETRIEIAQRISDLTLKKPIWLDDNNYIEQFPELARFSTTGHISGLQLCAVLFTIVEEFKEGYTK